MGCERGEKEEKGEGEGREKGGRREEKEGREKGERGRERGREKGEKGREKEEKGKREGRKGKEEKGKREGRKGVVEKEAGAGASGAERILTPLVPLKSYIKAVRPLYSEFDVHTSILGSSSSRDISTIIVSLANSENKHFSMPALIGLKSAIQKPHDVPAA